MLIVLATYSVRQVCESLVFTISHISPAGHTEWEWSSKLSPLSSNPYFYFLPNIWLVQSPYMLSQYLTHSRNEELCEL